MLSTMRQSWLVFALLALIALASAVSLEEALHIDGIEAYLHHGVKRQATTGTGNSVATDSEPSTTEPSSQEPTSTPDDTPTPTPTPTPTDSSDNPESTPPPSSQAPTSGRTTAPGSSPAQSTAVSTRITTPVVRTSALVATSVQEYVTVYTTLSDGQNVAVTSTSSSTALITTGQVLQTTLPEPQGGGDSGSGLSDTNKKIIGGVVGGVGGAILLGGIAIICWRMWGRKRHVSEDDADLMAGTGSALGDKPQNTGSPFQSNLEQYHNPGGRPNAAANF